MALSNNPTPNELVKEVKNLDTNKQATLVSGTNIKTINNESILGSGNITIGGGGISTDVQVDSTSITSGGVADLKTKNGNYNASTNKLVTENDLPDITDVVTHDDSVTTAGESTFADNYYTKTQIIDLIYPIGSVFITVNNVNPSTYLPNTNWEAIAEGKTLWTTTTNGTGGDEISAGLPNITGKIGRGLRAYGESSYTSGALYGTDQYNQAPGNGSFGAYGTINFDASLSNPIYGNSNTVQPPAIKVYMWKRIPLANS